MLIAVSGIVGSGKTMLANQIVALAETAGVASHHLPFQSLPCFRMLGGRRRTAGPSPRQATTDARPAIRWAGYQRKRLTTANALVYLARIIAFRLYQLSWHRGDWYVSNRYFYDLFVHYQLTGTVERAWFAMLRRLIPVPDLAILAVASPDSIAARRPTYAPEYLQAVSAAYASLPATFPRLVPIRTDADAAPSEETLRRLLGSADIR